jgi:CRP/FNR family cyclic AMP-dependent transcriptional regulator
VRFRTDAKIQLISRVPLLAGCSKRELGRIAARTDLVDFPQGETLMAEGASGAEFFVLVEGTARVSRRGRKLADLGPGDWVGEIALISNVPRTATVTATSPLQTLVLTRAGFSTLLRVVASIGTRVLDALGGRLAANTI